MPFTKGYRDWTRERYSMEAFTYFRLRHAQTRKNNHKCNNWHLKFAINQMNHVQTPAFDAVIKMNSVQSVTTQVKQYYTVQWPE